MAVVLPECKEIINAWIFDYVYAFVWDQFKSNHFVDDGEVRDLIQGSLYLLGDSYSQIQELQVLVIQLLCRLSDGEDFERQYVGIDELGCTVLEDAASLCVQLESHPLVDGCCDLSDLKADIMKQAVCVCCGSDSSRAEAVLQRLIKAGLVKSQQSLHDDLKMLVLSGKKLSNEKMYKKFLVGCFDHLNTINDLVKKPTLFEFAEKVVERMLVRQQRSSGAGIRKKLPTDLLKHCNGFEMEALKKNYNIKQSDIEQELDSNSLLRKQQSLSSHKQKHLRTLSRYWSHDDSNKADHDSPAKSPPVTSTQTDRADHHTSPHTSQGSPRFKNLRDFRLRRGEHREDRHGNSTPQKRACLSSPGMADGNAEEESSSPVLNGLPTLPPRKEIRRSLAPRPLKVFAPLRRPWSQEEVDMLVQGVQQYGVGNWATIKSEFQFSRTNVNLKDKWRQIKATIDLTEES